jgi:NDP-sugar pyrophosphorylase family protein
MGLTIPFGVVNGDTYHEFNFSAMMRAYRRLGCLAIIGLSKVNDTGRYGSVIYGHEQVLAFREKAVSVGPGWVNNGCYILSPRIFEQYTGACSIEKDIFVELADKKMLYAYRMKGEFIDIGIVDDYNRFVALFSK